MRIADFGSGTPVVVVPGIQGRWEWMSPGIRALAARCRVITFSLADEPTCGGRFEAGSGFDCYVRQIADAMDQAGVERAAICGVSYGGLVAGAFAARHPERTSALILVSALPPSWKPDSRVRFYLRAPRLLMPVFMLASLRMYREIAAAHPGRWAGIRESIRHGWNVLRHMFSPERMARRVRLLEEADLDVISRARVPTLVLTGEQALDRVVPVAATREYARLFPEARVHTLTRTGHLGLITRPDAFADVVAGFVSAGDAGRRRRIG